MTAFLAVLAVGVGTFLSRSIFILALADRTIPPRVIRALEFVGPAVLSALVVALMVDDSGVVAVGVPEAAALAAGGLAGWKRRNLIYVVAAGMTVFWVMRVWF
jgi:branched-subunit amino acid transport protein